MPEMTLFGWFHTVVGIVAILSGIKTLYRDKVIGIEATSAKIYLGCTLVAAVTALMIYKRGAFGPAHALAVLTLLALAVGMIAAKTNIFGKLSPYIQAVSFSGTFLFHMVPAITDGLMRLPVGDPVVKVFTDPFLQGFHLAFLLIYIIGSAWQVMWLRKQSD